MRVLVSPGPLGGGNPYLTLLYAAMGEPHVELRPFSPRALLRRHDVIHVHWPEYLVRWGSLRAAPYDVVKIVTLLTVARLRGAVVVWTAHNLEPHDLRRPRLWRFYFARFVARTDLMISMGEGATATLRSKYPRLQTVPTVVIPHGHYRDAYALKEGGFEARRALGLDERPVFLSFGEVRPYKKIEQLVREWHRLPLPRPQFVVAGRPAGPAIEAEIRRESRDHPDLRLILRFLDDSEVAELLAVADVVVLPHSSTSSLNSGAAILALSLGKPVVVTDTPAMRDLRATAGAEWVYLCDGTASDALRVAVRVAAGRPSTRHPDLTSLAWPRLSALTVDAYAAAIAARTPRYLLPLQRRPVDNSSARAGSGAGR